MVFSEPEEVIEELPQKQLAAPTDTDQICFQKVVLTPIPPLIATSGC